MMRLLGLLSMLFAASATGFELPGERFNVVVGTRTADQLQPDRAGVVIAVAPVAEPLPELIEIGLTGLDHGHELLWLERAADEAEARTTAVPIPLHGYPTVRRAPAPAAVEIGIAVLQRPHLYAADRAPAVRFDQVREGQVQLALPARTAFDLSAVNRQPLPIWPAFVVALAVGLIAAVRGQRDRALALAVLGASLALAASHLLQLGQQHATSRARNAEPGSGWYDAEWRAVAERWRERLAGQRVLVVGATATERTRLAALLRPVRAVAVEAGRGSSFAALTGLRVLDLGPAPDPASEADRALLGGERVVVDDGLELRRR